MEFEQGLRKRGAKPKSCVYVSTPITTGPLTLSGEMALDDLIEANVRHARQIVARAEDQRNSRMSRAGNSLITIRFGWRSSKSTFPR